MKPMGTMSVTCDLNEELGLKLEQEARTKKSPAAQIITDVLEAHFARQQSETDVVKKLVAEADEGSFIEEADMDAWMISLGTEKELPIPAAHNTK